MSSGRFVVIEGLDGVGKTTLVADLAHHLGGVPMDTPGPELRPLRSRVLDALGPDQLARGLFYAASVFAQGRRARSLADEGRLVVMDRYWASTIAYARARGVSDGLDGLEGVVPRANLTVLLTLDEAERRRRLAGRGDLTPADAETLCDGFRTTVLAELRQRVDRIVDVTGATRDGAVERVVDVLGEGGWC